MGQTLKAQAKANRREKAALGHLKQGHIEDYFGGHQRFCLGEER